MTAQCLQTSPDLLGDKAVPGKNHWTKLLPVSPFTEHIFWTPVLVKQLQDPCPRMDAARPEPLRCLSRRLV